MIDLSAIDREYREIGPAAIETWRHEFDRVNSPLLPFTDAMWTVAGEHSALCLGMMYLENQYATTGIIIHPGDYNPLSSRPWIGDPTASVWRPVIDWRTRQPIDRTIMVPGTDTVAVKQGVIYVPDYCVGAIVDGANGLMLRFESPQAAVWEWRRRIIDDRDYKGGVYNDAHTLTEMLDHYAPPGDVHPETDVDNADIHYPNVVKTKLIQYFQFEQSLPQEPEAPEETGMAGMKAYDFPGFPKNPVWLPDDIEVQIKLIPSSVAGWTSGQGGVRNQWATTWHDTGNDSSSANGEYTWAASGGRAAINSPGSYNGIFDKDRIIITQRFDELVGHAGVPSGNVQGWAFEQAYGTGFEAGLRVGAALHGGICAAMGWPVDSHLVQHNYWSGKDCPGQIRRRGIWSQVVAMTQAAALKAAAAAAGGQVPPTAPVFDAPVLIPELEVYKGQNADTVPYRTDGDGWVAIAVYDRVRAKRQTPRMKYATGGAVGKDIVVGEEFDVDFLLISTDFPDTYYSPYGTRIRAADCDRVSDVKSG